VSYCIERNRRMGRQVLICRGCLEVVKDEDGNGARVSSAPEICRQEHGQFSV
jgi:hypothetical protein